MPPAKAARAKGGAGGKASQYVVAGMYDSPFFLSNGFGDERAWLEEEFTSEEAVADSLPHAGDFTQEVRYVR
jgi:hypothetical protein